ncbi:MAG: hypothetical protein JXK05_01945 [Campylobacterales bacterium]|nr:hypothetical protein [Campylobacterales bacterium]
MKNAANKLLKYQDNPLILELLSCGGDADLVNKKLDELKIEGSDFTLEEIADILGITRERVRQIESSALKKLKSPRISLGLRDYIKEH